MLIYLQVKKAFTVRKGGRGPGPGSSSSNFIPSEEVIPNNASPTIGTRTGDTTSTNITTNSPNVTGTGSRSGTIGTGTGNAIPTGTGTSSIRRSTRVTGKETVASIVPLTSPDIPTPVCSPFQPELQAIVENVEKEIQKDKHSLPVLTPGSTSIKSKAGKPFVDLGKSICNSILLVDN
jgi:hypothetical protein